MIVRAHTNSSKKPKNPISHAEVLKLVEIKSSTDVQSSIVNNIQKDKLDEYTFGFLFRKIYPIIEKILGISNTKNLADIINIEDIEKLVLLEKAISCIDFGYEIFLNYLSEDEIVRMFEFLNINDQRIEESLERVLERIFTKFDDSANLFKQVIANRLIAIYMSKSKCQHELEFIYKVVLLMIDKGTFMNDIFEFYYQFILPLIVFCSLENTELSKNVVEAVCSISPECQRITLRHFFKIYYRVGSNEQIKILDLTSEVIHTNFFFPSKSFLEWEFSEIINIALKSESFVVIDAVIELIENSAVKKFIHNNLKIILPKIFENLYKLSKKFWRHEQRFKAIKTIGNILSFDHEVFEACLIEYNKKKHLTN